MLKGPLIRTEALCEHAEGCITDAVGRWTHTFSRCPVSVAACHSEAEMSPTNARHTQRLQAKRTATPTPKCDAKPSTEEYEQLRLLLPQCCLSPQLLFPLILSLRLLSPRART